MSSPWANIPVPEPTNLNDIMSEEALKELQIEGNKNSAHLTSKTNKFEKQDVSEDAPRIYLDDENDLASDAVIAKLLQQQFDEENILKRTKHSANTRLKIPILFSDTNTDLERLDLENESQEEDSSFKDFDDHDWDQFKTADEDITKYDITFYNEDGANFHSKGAVKKIKNSLKLDGKLNEMITRKFDEHSRLQLENMIERQILKKVNCVISTDQEAAILHAEYYSKHGQSRECLLKVLFPSPATRKFYKRDLKLRVEYEMKNYLRLKKIEILCPKVLGFKSNILIMSVTGKGLNHAQTLENAVLQPNEYWIALDKIAFQMRSLYYKAKLTYTNWSESNILWFNNNCYIIDASQIVELNHRDAFSLLMTNCINIVKFFRKKVPKFYVSSPEALLQRITWPDYHNIISSDLDQKLNQTITKDLDEYSKLQLDKMFKTQVLKRVNSVISTGKQAVILHAEYYSEYPESKECLLKVVFTSPAKKSTKKTFYKKDIKLRVEKDTMNLLRLKKAGILCPEVIGFDNNILIMSFTGKNWDCARTLQNAVLNPDEYLLAYEQVVKGMQTLYSKAKLIYANLSESTILWLNNTCYVIDVSQVVELNHIDVFSFLMTDCNNITKFFHKKVQDVMTPEELFVKITGFDYNNKMVLETVVKTLITDQHLTQSTKTKPYVITM